MLHIFLLILKIIGIVLLCILGVLLLGIFCVLFVPVRYRIEAVRNEGEGEPPVTLTVKVTWLLHLVNVLVRFTGSLSVRARIAIVTVFRLPKREKRGGTAVREGDKRKKTGEKPQEKDNADSRNETLVSGSEAVTEKNAEGGEKGDGRAWEEETGGEPDKKPTLWDKLRAIPKILRGIFEKIRSIFENIQYTIQNICDKMKSVSDTIEYYRGVIEGEAFRHSFALCKKELGSILKGLKPDRFEAALVVGMDDPATTGEILAVCGMLYPVLGPHVNVAGDFDERRLEGRVFIKGKLRFFTFVRTAVRIYFNKDIRKLYGLLKKEAV